ncbi:MAG TPA: hypothetical protein VG737_11880 [Cyclobacteriaceae bacterium]|nr:hypothetical protein [Cyclobacteriaceae bacterium]
MKYYSFIIAILLFEGMAHAQQEEHRPQIRGAIMMANSHVPSAIEGPLSGVIIPVWGFDVDYFFHRRWSVALQGDIKLQSYEVEDGDTYLVRTNPVALTGVLHYHLIRKWSFFFGPGYELEKHKNLFMLKTGTEYSFEVTEKFEIALNLSYENKQGIYDAITFGVAFNKRLWQKT